MRHQFLIVGLALCLVLTTTYSNFQQKKLSDSLKKLSESQRQLIGHVVRLSNSISQQAPKVHSSENDSNITNWIVPPSLLESTLAHVVTLELDRKLGDFQFPLLDERAVKTTPELIATPENEAATSEVLARMEEAIQTGKWGGDDFRDIEVLSSRLTTNQKDRIIEAYSRAVAGGRVDPRDGISLPPL